METPSRISVRSSAATWLVQAEAVRIGADVLVYIWGGERPHIGAVAAAANATASVLAFPGHKEDRVVKAVAEKLASRLQANVVVTAGLHWDNLSADGIAAVLERCEEIADLLLAALVRGDGAVTGDRPA
jgi:hypothetical protein